MQYEVIVTEWQNKFATDFWSDQLRSNPAVTPEQVALFAAELSDILSKRNPPAVCIVVKPQVTLELALLKAKIPEDAFPLAEIDMIFISDGSIQMRINGEWMEKRENLTG